MKQENKLILTAYADIKSKIKLLEVEAEELNPKVLEIMRADNIGEIEIENKGKLILSSRRTWVYSETVQNKEKALKALKKEEEQRGTADYTEKFFPMFKINE